MRTKLLVALLAAVPAFADEIVFRGVPAIRVISTTEHDDRKKLDDDAARNAECVIVSRGRNQYVWLSRKNLPMTRIDTPGFTYFVHKEGQGFVKVYTGQRKPDAPAEYVESITRDFDVITYWGRVATTNPQ